jgi:hypothetical protein
VKVAYTIITVPPSGPPAGPYKPLFDEAAGDTLEKVSGSFAGIVQKEPLAGGTAQARFARGNVAGKNQFRWNSVYASADAAQTAVSAINALKMTPVHLQLTEGNTVQYLPNSIAESYEFDRQGQSVQHTLTFESDDLTTIAP